jgi:hypothetical protein
MAKTKTVILKCRFGDHLPHPHKHVELPIESADYLIGEGLAEETSEKVEAGSVNKALETKVAELEQKNKALETKVAELQAIVDAVNANPPKSGGK